MLMDYLMINIGSLKELYRTFSDASESIDVTYYADEQRKLKNDNLNLKQEIG